MKFDLDKGLKEDLQLLDDALTGAENKWLALGVKDENVSKLIWECK